MDAYHEHAHHQDIKVVRYQKSTCFILTLVIYLKNVAKEEEKGDVHYPHATIKT